MPSVIRGKKGGSFMSAQSRKNSICRPSVVPPIGSMLVAEEYIVPQDLDFALEHQKHSKGLLGEILVRIGAVKPRELEKVLILQKNLAEK